MSHAPRYLMEDAREAERLAAKVNAGEWIEKYFIRHLEQSRRVLDVGCGPGVIAAEIARRYPHLEVIAVDRNGERFNAAPKLSNLHFECADATALPLTEGGFDFVYSRFLLEYLSDRQQAVKEMARVCRVGGTVVLQDLDGQLVWHYPVDEKLQVGIETTLAVLIKAGFDPFVGRKLFALARQAGLADVSVQVDPYHLIAGAIDEHNLRLWDLKLDIALPAIAKALGGETAAQAMKSRFLDYLQREDTLTYSVVFTVIGSIQQPPAIPHS